MLVVLSKIWIVLIIVNLTYFSINNDDYDEGFEKQSPFYFKNEKNIQ